MNNIQAVLDRMAITASSLCALHCAVLPIIIALFPMTLSTLTVNDESFHQMLALTVIPLSVVALFIGCRKHQDRMVLLMGITGVACLVTIAFFGHAILGEAGEKIGTLLSSLLIATAHFRNYFLCREDRCEHEEGTCTN